MHVTGFNKPLDSYMDFDLMCTVRNVVLGQFVNDVHRVATFLLPSQSYAKWQTYH